jgi:hypothetical protein
LDSPGCSEQGKLPAAKAFTLAERDKFMSEQEKPKSFMQELDQWTEANILRPLFHTDPNQEDWEGAEAQVKKAIREKVLESYHNGQKAGPRKFAPPVTPPARHGTWRPQ